MKLNIQRFADGSVSIEVGLDTKSFDAQISKLEYDLEELEETYKLALKDPDFGEENILKLQKDIETTKNKIIGLQKQQLALNKTTKEYSNSFGNVTSKLTKMGLAIFGIRSAYMLIRQSMSQIAQDNDALANKLNTIKNALATAIAPVAEWLINIVYKLLAYLNVITKTFLGIDLFAKTSKGAKATAGSLKSASGSAKELKKQLAGFDEMNVLSDTSSKSGGGGGGGGAITQPKEITPEPPDTSAWEKKIKEIKDQWSQLTSMSRKEIASYIRQTDSVWDTFGLGLFDWIQGVAKVLEGLGKTFKGVFEFIKGIALGDTELINQGIRNIMLGLKEFFEGLIQTSWAWIEIQLGILKGIVKSWFKFFGELISSYIDVMLTLPRTFVQTVKDLFNNAKTFFKNIYDAVKKLLTGDFKGALESFKKAFKSVFDSLWTIAKAPINLIINGINALIRGINKIQIKVPDWLKTLTGAKDWDGFNIKEIPRLAKGGIVNMPSRGIPIGGALAGERGAEGVIPLTDSQQMALLGEAIGRYITINAQITNTMNGRVISRELHKIQQENSFASNR